MPKHRKLHFEDQGQDFLWWEINEEEEVVDCGPFQASVWVGCQLVNDAETGIVEGDYPVFMTKTGDFLHLNYKIERIEEMEVVDGTC